MILLKNYSGQNVSVRGRPLVRGGLRPNLSRPAHFSSATQGAQLSGAGAYFNAKKNVSLSTDFHSSKHGIGSSGIGTLANA